MKPWSCTLPSLALWASIAAAPGVVSAQTPVAAEEAWRFQLTPYVWMMGLQGHVRPFRGAPTVTVDKPFSEALKDLDAAFFLAGTARKGRWVLHGDVTQVSTSESVRLPLGLSASTRVRLSSATLMGGQGWQLAPGSHVDLLGGVRLWDIWAQVRVPVLGAVHSDTSFVDPVVALRWRHALTPRWSALVYGDTGGFGLGSQSTLQWLGTLNYQWREQTYLSLGYRHLRVNYRDRGRHLDLRLGGLLLGVTFQF